MKTYAEYRKQVEEALSGQLRSLGEIPDILLKAMEYSLLAGGKRLRAVLLLASCEAIGGDTGKALPFACALEMIHTYSLIHDDLPAMDNDDLRRGQLTNHRKFGEDVAILAGDGLLSAAMELMARQTAKLAKAGDCSGVLAMEAIARHAGVTGMVAGQTMDVTSEGTKPTADKVRYIHLHKTADLLTAPVEAGLLLAVPSGGPASGGRDAGSGEIWLRVWAAPRHGVPDGGRPAGCHRYGGSAGQKHWQRRCGREADVDCHSRHRGHTRGRGTGNGLGGGCGSENRRRYEIFANPCTKHPEQSTIRDRIRALAPD